MLEGRSMVFAMGIGGSLLIAAPASADRILIDIGGGSRQAVGQHDTYLDGPTVNNLYWNTQPNRDGQILPDLIRADDGASTGISMDVTADFAGTRTETFSLDPSLPDYTHGAFTDTLFVQTGSAFEVAQLTFAGLDATGGTTYDFTFFASRNQVSDVREAQYSVVGGNGLHVVTLDASNNISEVVTASGVTADANGQILINIAVGPNNTSGYAYLNLIDIQTAAIPEPATLGLLGLGGVLVLARGRQ